MVPLCVAGRIYPAGRLAGENPRSGRQAGGPLGLGSAGGAVVSLQPFSRKVDALSVLSSICRLKCAGTAATAAERWRGHHRAAKGAGKVCFARQTLHQCAGQGIWQLQGWPPGCCCVVSSGMAFCSTQCTRKLGKKFIWSKFSRI